MQSHILFPKIFLVYAFHLPFSYLYITSYKMVSFFVIYNISTCYPKFGFFFFTFYNTLFLQYNFLFNETFPTIWLFVQFGFLIFNYIFLI